MSGLVELAGAYNDDAVSKGFTSLMGKFGQTGAGRRVVNAEGRFRGRYGTFGNTYERTAGKSQTRISGQTGWNKRKLARDSAIAGTGLAGAGAGGYALAGG